MLGERDRSFEVITRFRLPLLSFGGALVVGALATIPARANGAFPAVSQLVSDPGDADHLVLRSTFGLLVTRDRGASWDWLCEAGMGYKDVQPPMAVLPGGVILLAVPNGISRSDATGCDFALATGVDAMVLDLARIPTKADGAVAVSLTGTTAQLWRTDDAGMSFSAVGDPIASFIPFTVDVAPSDATVVYVSGLSGTQGTLLRSEDSGQSFDAFSVPNTTTAHRPFIAAIDPNDANVVYVRLDGEPSNLEVTRDGGKTFAAPLTTEVPALGLAVSPDGATVIASNSFDGTFRADATDLDFQKVACGGPSCLSFTNSGLFGCGDQRTDGFIVGRSDDLGATFERVVDLTCVRGPAACDPSTSIGRECPSVWPSIQAQIGATTCAPPDVASNTNCFGGAGDDGNTASAASGGSNASGGSAGAGGTSATRGAPSASGHTAGGGGCGCHVGASPLHSVNCLGILTSFGWLFWRRAQRRAVRRR
jgi:hypothetical protein